MVEVKKKRAPGAGRKPVDDKIKEIAKALCNFQGTVETVRKEAVNPFFKSKYASLANILDVVRKPLFDNGLSVVQLPAGEHQLTTIIMHTSGEWLEETYSMTPTKNDPQGLGSVITYQRRYALGAALGLNIDEDDDADWEDRYAFLKGLPAPRELYPERWLTKATPYTAEE